MAQFDPNGTQKAPRLRVRSAEPGIVEPDGPEGRPPPFGDRHPLLKSGGRGTKKTVPGEARMSSTRSDARGQPLDVLLAWWHSINPDGRTGEELHGEPGLHRVYRDERRRLHAGRVPLAYTIFLLFGAFATGLEFAAYPERGRIMLVAYAAYLVICTATIALVRWMPARTSIIAVAANNALILCTAAYYVPTRGIPEACAMTLVLFLAALPLLNGAGAGVQALSCLGALIGYPFVLLFGAPPQLPVSYGLTAICGATGVTVLGAYLLDRQRWQRKRAEDAARRHQAELAHVGRVSVMGEMAAGLAHELNQPLAAIVNFTRGCQRRLLASGAADAEMLHALDQVGVQALRAAQIIRRIRDFIRKDEPSLAWVDVNDLVRNVAELADPDGRQQGVHIDLALSKSVPKIYVDRIQIEQVILNLMRNGFDAMDGISVRPKTLSIRTVAADDGRVDVTVSDTGTGLSPEVVDRIFDPFFSTKPFGMGMGLSISRSIIEAHGGRLWAETNPTGGSRFHFSLSTEARAPA
jgi:signal transduction histidine kinase